jgi:WD40 repeat protein
MMKSSMKMITMGALILAIMQAVNVEAQAASDFFHSVSDDGSMRKWNTSTGSEITASRIDWTNAYVFLNLCYGLGGQVFFLPIYATAFGTNAYLSMYNASTNAWIRTFPTVPGILTYCYAHNTSVFASCTGIISLIFIDLLIIDGKVYQWSISTAVQVRTYSASSTSLYALYVSDTLVFSGSDDFAVRMYSNTNGTLMRTFTGHTGAGIRAITVYDECVFSGGYVSDIFELLH